MERNSFTKEHSMILKGFMIMMLLFHHVFFGDIPVERGIILLTGRKEVFSNLVCYARLCISGFAFISAYGITCQLMSCSGGIRDYFKICVNRLVKIWGSCLFIYVIAVVYKRFVVVQSIRDVYQDAAGDFQPLYMLFDGLGLANLFGTPKINVTWWYFSYAILMICAIPAILEVCRKIGIFAFPLSMFLFDSMVGIAVLGVLFAYEDVFGKLENMVKGEGKANFAKKAGIFLVCIVAIACSYSIVSSKRDSLSAMHWAGAVYAVIVMLYISKIPLFSTVMKWIGKHSATMFMTHTFIYLYFYGDFIYSFQKDYLIYGALFGTSLVTAVILDVLRRILCYDKLISVISRKINDALGRPTEAMTEE